jgi:PST family polysaccharide transporter
VDAFDVLRWQAVGTFLRVVSWPLGFLFLARGKRMLFFGSELVANLCYLGLVFFGVRQWQLPGVGVAFFGMYVVYVVLMTVLSHCLIGFRWSFRNFVLAGCLSSAVVAALASSYFFSKSMAVIVGTILFVAVGLVSIKLLHNMIGTKKFKSVFEKIAVLLHLGRP